MVSDMTTPKPWRELQTFLDRDGITQRMLAKRSGLSPSYINDLIHGRRNPNGHVRKTIADALNLPPFMLIPRQEEEAA